MREQVLQELWDERSAWSNVADHLKGRRTNARTAVLVLTLAGAALNTFAGTVSDRHLRTMAGAVGAAALAVVPIIAGYFLKPEQTRKWLRARSISEAIKSEFYRFSASAAPYQTEEALKLLVAKVHEIRNWGNDMADSRAAVSATVETPPGPLSPAEYLRQRVYEQISSYYEPKAQQNARAAERWRVAEIVLAGTAAVLSATATYVGGLIQLGPWVAVVTTFGGSVAAYAAAGRYEFQASSFYATAAELKDLARDWETSAASSQSQAWSEFVNACEQVISAENRGWMAKLDEHERENGRAAVPDKQNR